MRPRPDEGNGFFLTPALGFGGVKDERDTLITDANDEGFSILPRLDFFPLPSFTRSSLILALNQLFLFRARVQCFIAFFFFLLAEPDTSITGASDEGFLFRLVLTFLLSLYEDFTIPDI